MSIMFKSKGLASSQTIENSSKYQQSIRKPIYYLAVEDKSVASVIFNAYEIDTVKTLYVQNSAVKNTN